MVGDLDFLPVDVDLLLQAVGPLHQVVVLIHPVGELVQLVLQQGPGLALLKIIVQQANRQAHPAGDDGHQKRFVHGTSSFLPPA